MIPSVAEISGMKHLHISPSILVEQILPGNGVKYTATVTAGKRIKTGTVTFRLAVTDTRGQIVLSEGIYAEHGTLMRV